MWRPRQSGDELRAASRRVERTEAVKGQLQFAAGGVFLLWRHAAEGRQAQQLRLENPLDLATVLKFGALLMVVTVLAKVATATAGSTGAFALAALSGLADTLSMARTGADQIGVASAAAAIAIAVGVNTLSKAALGWAVGGTRTGCRLLIISL